MTGIAWPLNVPVLTDGTVTLRAHVPADIDRALEMAQDPQMVRWTAIPTPHTRQMSEQFHFEHVPRGWNEGTAMGWAIEFEGRYAGNLDVRGTEPVVDLGFSLHPDCRDRGVMTAAVNLAVDHVFVEAGREVVRWRAHIGNVASLRVAHACGFRLHDPVPALLVERDRVLDVWYATRHFGDAPLPRTTWLDTTVATDAFVLRPPVEGDLARWAETESDTQSRHWFAQSGRTTDDVRRALHRSWWLAAKGERATWTVADPHDDRFLGQIVIDGVRESSPEIGYLTHPDARGRGLTSAAVRVAVEHALDADGLDLRRLELHAAVGNAASLAIAARAGFVEFGRRTAAEPLGDGTRADLIGFERIR